MTKTERRSGKKGVAHRHGGGITCAAVTTLLFAGGSDVRAQEAAEDQSAEIETIIVTASRRAEAIQHAPVAVSAINPDEFAIQGMTSLDDVAYYTPGVKVESGGTAALKQITMRGVSQSNNSPTVGVYLDDIPLGGAGAFAGAALQAPDLVNAGMERIEFIKGPQGTLYGATSMGGVVRYITGDPSLDEAMYGGFVMDVSEISGGGSSNLGRAWLSAPLVKDRLGVRVSGFLNNLGGFVDRDAASVSGAGSNVNETRIRGGHAKLTGHLTGNLTASFQYFRSDTEFEGVNSINYTGPPFEPALGRFLSLQGEQQQSTSIEVFGGTLEYQADWGSLLSSTSHQVVKREILGDVAVVLGPLIELLAGAPPGSVTSAPQSVLAQTERTTQEFRVNSKRFFDDRLEWIGGAFFSREEGLQVNKISGQPIDFTILDVDLPANQDQIAVFANATFFVTPKFDITVGARLSETSTDVTQTDSVNILINSVPTVEEETTDDTYMFNARYRPVDNLSLYTRVASGFRPSMASIPVLDESGNPAVPPIIHNDTLWSYEVGVKGSTANGLLTYDFAGWHIVWKDLQSTVTVRGVGTAGNAASDITASGVEGAVGLHPADWLSVSSNFAYTRSKLDDDETAAFGGVAGEDMPWPRWTGSLNVNMTYPLVANAQGFAGFGVRYVGSQNTGFEGGVGQDGSVIDPLVVNFPLDSYTIADLRFGVTAGRARVSVYATNLFDRYAISNASAVPVVQGISATAQIVQPRTIGAVLSVDF